MNYFWLIVVWFVCGAIAVPIERKMVLDRHGFVPKGESIIAFFLGPITLLCVFFGFLSDINKK
jgi:hypothetical protein